MTKKRSQQADVPPIPAIYALTYLQLCEEQGGDPVDIAQAAGLDYNDLLQPNTLIDQQKFLNVLIQSVTFTRDNGIAVEAGLRIPPTAFGNLGYGLICSETAGDALDLCMRFWRLLDRDFTVTQNRNEDTSYLEFSEIETEAGLEVHTYYEFLFSSFYRGFELLLPNIDTGIELWFKFSPPEHADKVQSLLKNVHYNQPAYQIRFHSKILDMPLPMHNPTGLKFAIEQCEREISLYAPVSNKYSEQIRQKLVFSNDGYLTIEDLSKQLNLTARTLRRRLEDEGTTYSTLLEEAKRRDAIVLLDKKTIEVRDVALLLGYQDPANFTRAFKQWTGQTPSQYRSTRMKS